MQAYACCHVHVSILKPHFPPFGVYQHPQQTVGCSVYQLPLPWIHDSQPQPDSACLQEVDKHPPVQEALPSAVSVTVSTSAPDTWRWTR